MNGLLAHKDYIIWTCIIVIFLLERISKNFDISSSLNDNKISRWTKNFIFGLVNSFLLPLATIPVILFATSHALWHRPYQNNPISIFADILILDCASYWFHRFSHVFPPLWRLHEIHHLDPVFDMSTGLRIHFAEIFLANLFRGVAIISFAIPLHSALIYGFILVLEGLFHHSNINFPSWLNKLLDPVIITPVRHSAHHHAFIPDTDSNYGFIFIWWDKLFGTINYNERTSDWRMGLEYTDDLSLIDLFISPFKKIPLKERNKIQPSGITTEVNNYV